MDAAKEVKNEDKNKEKKIDEAKAAKKKQDEEAESKRISLAVGKAEDNLSKVKLAQEKKVK